MAVHADREGLSFALHMSIMAAVPTISKSANHVSFLVWVAVYSKRCVLCVDVSLTALPANAGLIISPAPLGGASRLFTPTPRTSDAADVYTLFAQHAGMGREFCKCVR